MTVAPGRKLLTFTVLIERSNHRFRARVVRAPAGTDAECFFDDTIDLRDCRALAAQFDRDRSTRRTHHSENTVLASKIGTTLFHGIFRDSVLEALRRSFAIAREQRAGLRLTLQLAGAPQLMTYPWELLHDPQARQFLALQSTSPVVRFIDRPAGLATLSAPLPLRILFVAAAPGDLEQRDGDEQWKALLRGLERFIENGDVVIDRLLRPTLARLEAQLDVHEYHAVHFMGHGGYRAGTHEGFIIFENADGLSVEITADTVGTLVRERGVRLVVLGLCKGARKSPTDLFVGIAQSFVLADVPAVVDLQCELSDSAANACNTGIYGSLANGLPIDIAVTRARKKMRANGPELEWAGVLLYTCLRDGALFDFGPTTRTVARPQRRAAASGAVGSVPASKPDGHVPQPEIATAARDVDARSAKAAGAWNVQEPLRAARAGDASEPPTAARKKLQASFLPLSIAIVILIGGFILMLLPGSRRPPPVWPFLIGATLKNLPLEIPTSTSTSGPQPMKPEPTNDPNVVATGNPIADWSEADALKRLSARSPRTLSDAAAGIRPKPIRSGRTGEILAPAVQESPASDGMRRGSAIARNDEMRAKQLFDRGNYSGAIAALIRAIQHRPRDAKSFAERGYAYYVTGRYDKAVADLNRAIQLAPNDDEAFDDRADVYDAKGDYRREIADLSRSIAIRSSYSMPYFLRGRAYVRLGKPDLALADFSRAIETMPGHRFADAYFQRGKLYLAAGDYDRAIPNFDQAIEGDGGAEVYAYRGAAYEKKHEYGRAMADFARAVELEPDDTEASADLNRVKLEAGVESSPAP